jgi:serine/threonine protein kinase
VKAKLVFGVAAGLMHLHAHGFVHGHLHPGNIMFDSNHEPRIVDFCFAKLSQNLPLGYQRTPEPILYLAPEEIEGAGKGPEADCFAFALILFHIVTGRPAYSGFRNPLSVQNMLMHGVRPTLERGGGILNDIIEAGWDLCPVSRPSFAQIVAELVRTSEPLFPGVHMGEYCEYRDRVMRDTVRSPENEKGVQEQPAE